jgi:hypothetical protein
MHHAQLLITAGDPHPDGEKVESKGNETALKLNAPLSGANRLEQAD